MAQGLRRSKTIVAQDPPPRGLRRLVSAQSDANTAVDCEWIGRTEKPVVHARAIGDTAGGYPRSADSGRAAEDSVGRVPGIEQIVDVAEHLKPSRGLIGKMQTDDLIAWHRCVLIALIPELKLICDEFGGGSDRQGGQQP